MWAFVHVRTCSIRGHDTVPVHVCLLSHQERTVHTRELYLCTSLLFPSVSGPDVLASELGFISLSRCVQVYTTVSHAIQLRLCLDTETAHSVKHVFFSFLKLVEVKLKHVTACMSCKLLCSMLVNIESNEQYSNQRIHSFYYYLWQDVTICPGGTVVSIDIFSKENWA